MTCSLKYFLNSHRSALYSLTKLVWVLEVTQLTWTNTALEESKKDFSDVKKIYHKMSVFKVRTSAWKTLQGWWRDQ